MGHSNNTQKTYILHIHGLIRNIRFENVERRLVHAAERRSRGIWRSSRRSFETWRSSTLKVITSQSGYCKVDWQVSQLAKVEAESMITNDVESGQSRRRSTLSLLFRFVSKIYLEAFTLTFLAEWGDRSQLTTIILAAREVRPWKLFLQK